jgi:hypothetical protein
MEEGKVMANCPYCGRPIPESPEFSRMPREGLTYFNLALCYQVNGWGNYKELPADIEVEANICNQCFKNIRREILALITRLQKPLQKGGETNGPG